MNSFDFAWKVVESQGLVASMLAFLIWSNTREKRDMMKKICELNHFIMDCFKMKLDEDSTLASSQTKPNETRTEDLLLDE